MDPSGFAASAGVAVSRRRPASWPCSCGAPAVVEKAGRTVCRACAAKLPPSREFPLRKSGWDSIQPGEGTLRIQLDMPKAYPRLRYQEFR